MIGDYVSILHCENGFYVEVNAFAQNRPRKKLVAIDEAQLYEVIAQIFPRPISLQSDAPNEVVERGRQ